MEVLTQKRETESPLLVGRTRQLMQRSSLGGPNVWPKIDRNGRLQMRGKRAITLQQSMLDLVVYKNQNLGRDGIRLASQYSSYENLLQLIVLPESGILCAPQ